MCEIHARNIKTLEAKFDKDWGNMGKKFAGNLEEFGKISRKVEYNGKEIRGKVKTMGKIPTEQLEKKNDKETHEETDGREWAATHMIRSADNQAQDGSKSVSKKTQGGLASVKEEFDLPTALETSRMGAVRHRVATVPPAHDGLFRGAAQGWVLF